MEKWIGSVMYMLLGIALSACFGFILFYSISTVNEYRNSPEILTLPAEYVSSEEFTETNDDGQPEKKYRVTRQCTVHEKTITYTSTENTLRTDPVSVTVYLDKDGRYQIRQDKSIFEDGLFMILMGGGVLLGIGFVAAGLWKLFRPKIPAKEQE